ncbi:hypothetical protein RBH26_12900 [Natronolimnohabitans sp. A-GB9]|uniref:DUF7288 family protein n=1 Tax=Natronolimnohabitans sp. A-GB9 TaxID=3069757 RepID=UPI0027B56F5A|nr:hypothetical protein [Natronolimnohabitans sp. A-GB9]MDQ2051374.1 hypothetical protein [Natronolimnohabitans sp. A-GB9]
MREQRQPRTDRGQAYTLEGFVSAMIVLLAVLFAMQAVVITPTTGGLADRTTQAQVEQEGQDALVISATAEDGDLSELVRYWDEEEGEFYNASESHGDFYYDASNDTEFYDNFVLGETLSDRFTERGLSYNVELVYQDDSGEFDSEYLVYQGESEAVTASYMVTLYESDTVTAPNGDEGEEQTLRQAHCDEDENNEHCYPIPPATDDTSEIYNVVEVRIAVW